MGKHVSVWLLSKLSFSFVPFWTFTLLFVLKKLFNFSWFSSHIYVLVIWYSLAEVGSWWQLKRVEWKRGSGKVSAWWSRSEIGWYKAVGSTLRLLNFGTALVMFKSTRLPLNGEKHTNRKADLQTDNWNKLWADTEIKCIKIHWQTRKWHWNR